MDDARARSALREIFDAAVLAGFVLGVMEDPASHRGDRVPVKAAFRAGFYWSEALSSTWSRTRWGRNRRAIAM